MLRYSDAGGAGQWSGLWNAIGKGPGCRQLASCRRRVTQGLPAQSPDHGGAALAGGHISNPTWLLAAGWYDVRVNLAPGGPGRTSGNLPPDCNRAERPSALGGARKVLCLPVPSEAHETQSSQPPKHWAKQLALVIDLNVCVRLPCLASPRKEWNTWARPAR